MTFILAIFGYVKIPHQVVDECNEQLKYLKEIEYQKDKFIGGGRIHKRINAQQSLLDFFWTGKFKQAVE